MDQAAIELARESKPGGRLTRRGVAELDFSLDPHERTYLKRHYASYPFHVTRPFYLDAALPEAATVYVQSASGGLFQEDQLSLRIGVGVGAIAHVTTQSATKVHTMERGAAHHSTTIKVERGGHLDYINDPVILFPRSNFVTSCKVQVDRSASAIIAESFLWHDPTQLAATAHSTLRSEIIISAEDGRIVAIDRMMLSDSDRVSAQGVLDPYRMFGTVIAVGRRTEAGRLLNSLRELVSNCPDVYAGASDLPENIGTIVRVLANDGAILDRLLKQIWGCCHEIMLGWCCAPRRK